MSLRALPLGRFDTGPAAIAGTTKRPGALRNMVNNGVSRL